MDDEVEISHIEDISLDGHSPPSLLQLLSNPLVLYHTIPFLNPLSLLNLGRSSKSFRELLYKTPNVFRYLDLTQVKSARSEIGSVDNGAEIWRNVQVDENVTEDDFYGGPLRGIFNNLRRRDILKDVQTLILDGLAVPSDLVAEIILDQSFSVRLLSIREVQHLNEPKLMQALQYAVRPSRPKNSPKLEGLYIFGPKDPSSSRFRRNPDGTIAMATPPVRGGVLSSRGAQIGAEWNQKSEDALWQALEDVDRWFEKSGRVIPRQVSDSWAGTLHACQGIISFDAVLCSGPRHSLPTAGVGVEQDISSYLSPTVATFAIDGCSGCGTSPEGFSYFNSSPLERFPLLSPLPLHSSSAKAAKAPLTSPHRGGKKLLVRCADCLRQRHCDSCQRWWCEDCYKVQAPGGGFVSSNAQTSEDKNVKIGVIRSCFECGFNCASCVNRTQLMCKICAGGYCTIHNEGSTLTTCDWCARTRSRRGEMY